MDDFSLGPGEGYVGEGEAGEGMALHGPHLKFAVKAVLGLVHQLPAAPVPEGLGLEDAPAGHYQDDDNRQGDEQDSGA